jgi:cation:H+ antiporter
MVFLYVLLLLVSFVALVKGADIFVDGSAGLAKLFNVSSVIIGLTVVALGTSMPELAVSTSAALQGSNEIAVSNVIGSNLFNLLMVLGICAVIHPVPVDKVIIRRDFPFSIVLTIVMLLATSAASIFSGRLFSMGMEEVAGNVTRILAVFFIAIFICYIAFLIYDARKHPVEAEEIKKLPLWKCLVFIVVGLALIVAGGKLVVYSAQQIARAFGMSETLIGLTIIAIGTSLPELVTSIVAARKGEVALAVGNVVGSNIFNILLILGVSSTIHPVAVVAASVYDMGILLFVSLLTLLFSVTKKSILRWEGLLMIACYVATTVFAIVR